MTGAASALPGDTPALQQAADDSDAPAQGRDADAPLDLAAYHLGRIAAWSLPRYRLNQRFVALSLLVDQGEDANNAGDHIIKIDQITRKA